MDPRGFALITGFLMRFQ